jgi:hypothetical protein
LYWLQKDLKANNAGFGPASEANKKRIQKTSDRPKAKEFLFVF